jgi:indole-3-glycerol phosphate synthase
MNILEKIVLKKRDWVAQQKAKIPVERLLDGADYRRTTISLLEKVKASNDAAIIAEFKRKSPSKGNIYEQADVVQVTTAYQKAGASAISILTDQEFFGGSDQDLIDARTHLNIPILRKDFIIDGYQIHEAKALGADVILLIAACLSTDEVKLFSELAKSLDLEVLLELHDEVELGHICSTVDFVGINNRSLKTFDVDIQRSLAMANAIPDSFCKVAESGINDPEQIKLFKSNGFEAFLIGEYFMKTHQPGVALEKLIQQI